MSDIGVQERQDTQGRQLVLRSLEAADYRKGYLELLQQLTTVGEITEPVFADRFHEISSSSDYHIAVIEDAESSKVVATATLLIEKKFIHGCGKVGHIEDVVVDSTFRGQKLGQRVVTRLVDVAAEKGCYKVILDCAESNAKFYEICGFKKKELQMVCYFE